MISSSGFSGRSKSAMVFAALWIVTFVIYLPAAGAGKVGDYYQEWVARVNGYSVKDYFFAPWGDSLYYFILAEARFFYKLFGLNPLPWHIIAVTLHVTTATFLYIIFYRLLTSPRISHARMIAAGSALLYCVTPYNSEVIVNDHCSSYIPSYLLVVSVVLCAQNFIYSEKKVYAWAGGMLYAMSCFSIEIFYLTPFFVFTLAWYYTLTLQAGSKMLKKVVGYFILPELAIFSIYMLMLVRITGHIVAHRVNTQIGNIQTLFLSTSPKRLFHAVLLGRFFPGGFKQAVYHFFDTAAGMAAFGVLAACCGIFIVIAVFRGGSNVRKAAALFLTWILLILVLTASSYFPRQQLVAFDRYVYFILPGIYVLLLLLATRVRPVALGIGVMAAYCIANVLLLVKINGYWYHSSKIIGNLLNTYPVNTGKVVLLLNPPESMNGVLMIGSKPMSFYDPYSAFKLMYNLERKNKITDTVADIASSDMIHPGDGAHVTVVNDSTLNVTLNQRGTQWWQYYRTAADCDLASLYKLRIMDTSSWYQLTLREPAWRYLLLYTVGGQWKVVDWNKKNIDQY